MKKLTYENYLDKVYGCFLGKTVIGTLGAPFEGVKMPLELPFLPEMVNTMLPNDDLDLQILWLEVVEKRGTSFTPYDLHRAFCENCDYSPGEYAVMRKNYERGIYPPTSGRYCNDFYINGMGCPIRSEIWACLSPLDPARAADLASRDGILDHEGDSVYGERFFAALESAAFFESDLDKLIEIGLTQVPEKCKFRDLVNDTVALCKKYDDIKLILRKILFKYGHPDCTNLYQNIGITLAALLKGNMDIIKIGMDALNCGFDTDCTCATAGAVVGIIKGAKALEEEYGFSDVKFVLEVRANRRSDSVRDLSEDIALLGTALNSGKIEGAPETNYSFEPSQYPLSFDVSYENGIPVMSPDEPCYVKLNIKNVSKETVAARLVLSGKGVEDSFSLVLTPKESAVYEFDATADGDIIYDKNLYSLRYTVDGKESEFTFGVAGAMPWKVIGPIWRTDPICNTELLQKCGLKYRNLIDAVEYDGDRSDISRRFHLNFAVDTATEYMKFDECFAPYDENALTKYEESVFWQKQDSFSMDDMFGFKGPCVVYLAREYVAPEDMEVCVQFGHSSPVELYLNGELLARRDSCDCFDAENIHLRKIMLKKGANRVLIRLTRANSDTKLCFNFVDKQKPSCARHHTCFGAVVPTKFGKEQ